MAADLPQPVVGITTLWVTTILYSFNVVLFAVCLWVLLKKRQKHDAIPWILLTGISMQFILSTVHISMMLAAAVHAFMTVKTTAKELIATWIDVFGIYTEIQQLMEAINTLLGDMILIWRLFVVYGNSWAITIVPILLALASGGCTLYAGALTFTSPTKANSRASRAVPIAKVVEAGFAMTATTQILVTLLIGARIWWMSRHLSSNKYMGIVWMLLESGAALAMVEIIWLGVWQNRLIGLSQLILGMLGQLCALFPLSIIVRVGLGLAVGGKTKKAPLSTFAPASRMTWPEWRSGGHTGPTETTATADSEGVLRSEWKHDTERAAGVVS